MKNKFLLLGATALLSTALAANVRAEAKPVTANLNVDISIYDTFSVDAIDGKLLFPAISTKNPAGSGKVRVKVRPDGTIDPTGTNAQILQQTSHTTPIIISGGNLGYYFSDYENTLASAAQEKGNALTVAEIAEIGEEFAMSNGDGAFDNYVAILSADGIEANTLDLKAGNKVCGTVKEFTTYYRYVGSSANDAALELRYGGTFELADDYVGGLNRSSCSGNLTVTLVTTAF